MGEHCDETLPRLAEYLVRLCETKLLTVAFWGTSRSARDEVWKGAGARRTNAHRLYFNDRSYERRRITLSRGGKKNSSVKEFILFQALQSLKD